MEQNLIDIYDLIKHAIDNAFEGQMNLDFMIEDTNTKSTIDAFIETLVSGTQRSYIRT